MILMAERTIIFGDIHGCLDEFNDLIKKVSYDSEKDRLILAGDLVDRGPDSLGVIRKAREMKLECVRGNHEEKFLKWFRSHNSRVDVYDKKDYYTKMSDEDIQYISNMPTYLELEDVVIVHAGLKPGIRISEQSKDDLLYLRYTDSDRKFISIKKVAKLGKEETGARFWTEFGPFNKKYIIYGHKVWDEPRIDKFDDGSMCIGIDTGCCFGGKLTAFILESHEFISVSAKQIYFNSGTKNGNIVP